MYICMHELVTTITKRSSNADRSANLDHLAGAALRVGSLLTTWRLALMPASLSLTPPAAVGQRLLVLHEAVPVIVAPQRQATSTCKVTAAQVRKKQAEEDTFINQAGR